MNNLSQPDTSITSRVVKGGAWIFGGQIANRGLQLIKSIVLARLLTPADFGLFGIVLLALNAFEAFTQTGFEKALIQRRDDARQHLDAAWTMQLIRNLALTLLLYTSAPFIGRFFNEPRAIQLLRVLSLTKAITGFKNIGIIYFSKELDFKKKFILDTVQNGVTILTGITLAFIQRSVWALVWSTLAGTVSASLLSYVLHPYRPHFQLNPRKARTLFTFGKWVFGDTLVTFVSRQADRIILGKLLDVTALGFYNMADKIGGLLPTEFMHLTNNIMLPAYAKVQDDSQRIGRAFLQVFLIAALLSGPSAVFIILAAPDLVHTVLGDAWGGMVAPMQVLAFGAFLRCVIGVSAPIFLATGHPHIQFWKSVIRAIVTVTAVFPLTARNGITGTAWATVLGVVALSPIFYLAMRIARVSPKQLLSALLPAFFLTAAAAVGVQMGKLFPGSVPFTFVMELLCSLILILVAGTILLRTHRDLAITLRRYLKTLFPQQKISDMLNQ